MPPAGAVDVYDEVRPSLGLRPRSAPEAEDVSSGTRGRNPPPAPPGDAPLPPGDPVTRDADARRQPPANYSTSRTASRVDNDEVPAGDESYGSEVSQT
jgi:hypothetical protein